jgi:F0F1-type ATP synthase membrane subunit b/b'
MTRRSPREIAEEAARAARQAADEASTPEARFFLREHANLLARIAATHDRAEDGARRSAGVAAVAVPLLAVLPG